jgi:hypothetical protein
VATPYILYVLPYAPLDRQGNNDLGNTVLRVEKYMNKPPKESDLQTSKSADNDSAQKAAVYSERSVSTRSSGSSSHGDSFFAKQKQSDFTLSDEAIALAFSYHFTWGYPDYMREALRLVSQPGAICDALGIDPNRDLTWKQLRIVFEEADSNRVRYMVAGNPTTPSSVLNYLADDKDARVVRRVAENRNTHASTLARLAMTGDDTVRMGICENPSAPELVLLSLTRDPHVDVRYALAENVHAPVSVIELLSLDENPYIASRANRTLKVLRPAEVLAPDFSRVARRRIGRASSNSV